MPSAGAPAWRWCRRRVHCPRATGVPTAVSGAPHGVMLLTSVVQGFVARLFPGLEVKAVHQFRVTRNSELFVDDEEITDLREALQGELRQRHYGDAPCAWRCRRAARPRCCGACWTSSS